MTDPYYSIHDAYVAFKRRHMQKIGLPKINKVIKKSKKFKWYAHAADRWIDIYMPGMYGFDVTILYSYYPAFGVYMREHPVHIPFYGQSATELVNICKEYQRQFEKELSCPTSTQS